jgi:hypothetical protein
LISIYQKSKLIDVTGVSGSWKPILAFDNLLELGFEGAPKGRYIATKVISKEVKNNSFSTIGIVY